MSDFHEDPVLAARMRAAAEGAADLGSSPEGTRRRAHARRARRTVVVGVSLVALGVISAAAVLSQPSPTTTLRVTTTPKPSASASPTAAQTAAPSTSPATVRLVLNGDDLGVTAVGEPYAAAVAAVAEVLGPPEHDPASTAGCFRAEHEVEWDRFRLAFDAGVLTGWSSSDPQLRTPSGVGVGSTVATLRRVYGERLALYPANPDNAETFSVSGVDLAGYLTGLDDTDTVTTVYNGSVCGGP